MQTIAVTGRMDPAEDTVPLVRTALADPLTSGERLTTPPSSTGSSKPPK